MDDPTKHRVNLWLRGERAFGLSLVGPRPQPSSTPLTASVAASAPSRAEARVSPVHAEPSEIAVVNSPPLFEAPPADSSPAQVDMKVLSLDEKREKLVVLNQTGVSGCTKCRLCETRTNTVFGEGDPDARIFFIGEGPGETEDLTGRPFVGRAGELLNKQIDAMGLRREQVFIANIVKCRPPNNRVPASDEVATCTPYLEQQLEIVRPRVIVTLGLPAAKYMLGTNSTMGRLRGQWQRWRDIKLMPTYHPAFLLRAPTYENRSAVWSDLQKVMAEVGLPVKQDSHGS